jgi:hypothetical protein
MRKLLVPAYLNKRLGISANILLKNFTLQFGLVYHQPLIEIKGYEPAN